MHEPMPPSQNPFISICTMWSPLYQLPVGKEFWRQSSSNKPQPSKLRLRQGPGGHRTASRAPVRVHTRFANVVDGDDQSSSSEVANKKARLEQPKVSQRMVEDLKYELNQIVPSRMGALESEIGALQHQLHDCEHFLGLEQQTTEALQQQVSELMLDLALLRGDEELLRELNLQDCEELTQELEDALEAVAARKKQLAAQDMEKTKHQRLCSICWEAEKTIVLLPCRHFCLCMGCSSADKLDSCPICRQAIREKFAIFA